MRGRSGEPSVWGEWSNLKAVNVQICRPLLHRMDPYYALLKRVKLHRMGPYYELSKQVMLVCQTGKSATVALSPYRNTHGTHSSVEVGPRATPLPAQSPPPPRCRGVAVAG